MKTNQRSELYVPKIRDAEPEYGWIVLEGFKPNSRKRERERECGYTRTVWLRKRTLCVFRGTNLFHFLWLSYSTEKRFWKCKSKTEEES